jgi:hypothetical protein
VLTDVDAVMAHFGTAQATALPRLDLDGLARLSFAAGSMGPKIDACRHFVGTTGHPASIGSLTDAAAVLDGTAGATVTGHRKPAWVTLHDPAPAGEQIVSGGGRSHRRADASTEIREALTLSRPVVEEP